MHEQPAKQCVIYCRVSTKEQVEEGNSLITQERLCREYAAKHGYFVVQIYIEQGESAKTVDRTELKKLISYCTIKKNKIDAVIIYKIDRLSRNTDDYSQIRIMLKQYAVEIKSISEYFEDTPAGRFMENIIANVAQFDNDVRAERSVNGMKEAVKEGRYVWMAPLGYSNRKVDGKATIIPNEQAHIIKGMFKALVYELKPIEEIRRELLTNKPILLKGKCLSKSNFYRLLRNELYCGIIRKFGKVYEGKYEPLISKELFYQAQDVLKGKKKSWAIKSTEDFPLRRFLQHPSGKAVTGCWAQGKYKKYPYYMVQGHNFNVRKEILEETFFQWLDQFKLDVSLFKRIEEKIKDELAKAAERKPLERTQMASQIKDLKETQANLIDKNIAGVIPDDLCRDRLNEITVELARLSEKLNTSDDRMPDVKEILVTARKVMLEPGRTWKEADYKHKVWLQSFYFPEGITIENSATRTPKICKLFKVKSMFSGTNSRNVHHPVLKLNTFPEQISLTWQTLEIIAQDVENDNPLTTVEIMQELSHLSEQLKREGTSE